MNLKSVLLAMLSISLLACEKTKQNEDIMDEAGNCKGGFLGAYNDVVNASLDLKVEVEKAIPDANTVNKLKSDLAVKCYYLDSEFSATACNAKKESKIDAVVGVSKADVMETNCKAPAKITAKPGVTPFVGNEALDRLYPYNFVP